MPMQDIPASGIAQIVRGERDQQRPNANTGRGKTVAFILTERCDRVLMVVCFRYDMNLHGVFFFNE